MSTITASEHINIPAGAAGGEVCEWTLPIEGMTCAACIGDIERGLRDLPGLVSARVNYTNRRLALEWRDENFDLTTAFARLRRMGYDLHPFELADSERAEIDKLPR